MKTVARYLIYIGAMLAALVVMAEPFVNWPESGPLDMREILVRTLIGFSLIFFGTEASEGLKKRWGK